MEDRLQEFLRTFYETISFESIEQFDSLKFEGLFLQNASLAQRNGDLLKAETILQYIDRFHYEVRHFPEYYANGFKEEQLDYESLVGEDFTFVKSKYRKTYFDGTSMVTKDGCNYMTLCSDGTFYKIVSIAWTE